MKGAIAKGKKKEGRNLSNMCHTGERILKEKKKSFDGKNLIMINKEKIFTEAEQ